MLAANQPFVCYEEYTAWHLKEYMHSKNRTVLLGRSYSVYDKLLKEQLMSFLLYTTSKKCRAMEEASSCTLSSLTEYFFTTCDKVLILLKVLS